MTTSDGSARGVSRGPRHPLMSGLPPAWAVGWGEDEFGAFATFAVGPPEQPVEQRMRWIPPGSFPMGSPEDELGRFEDEGPQHQVTLTHGYWLGDTPVTQALWAAVKGDHPSRFTDEGEQRPVEQVSWNDCRDFLVRLNGLVRGLEARLPTEAEWERACRGGTTTATWVGNLSSLEKPPELEPVAWYGGNSGSQTHPVGRRRPNPYGLHDMLGNVFEWCEDSTEPRAYGRRYTEAPVSDPFHSYGSGRVNRGGSWIAGAGIVRAAFRIAGPPDIRIVALGFRLAGGQGSAPSR